MHRIRITPLAVAGLAALAACRDATTPTPAANDLTARVTPYAAQQVRGWFDVMATEGLALSGTVMADYDERTNRVVVGVEHAAAARNVRSLAARLRVPAEAIEVREMEPIRNVVSLRDRVTPRVGGIQIHWDNFLCTLGFNAVDGSQNSFITNSHCSGTQGGVQNTVYYQPLSSVDGASIATEVEDPAYQRNIPGCPRGKQCRRSDAARAAYNSGISFTLGRIAQTSGVNNGSLEITGFLDFTGEDLRDNFPIGTAIRKIGRTTGMTEGNVTATCATVNVSGTRFSQICQTIVERSGATLVGGGDSGSPVYVGSALAGILWGGNSSGTLFVFSPLKNIEAELGALTTR